MHYAFKLHCPHAPDNNGLITLNYDHLAYHQIITEAYCTELWTLQHHIISPRQHKESLVVSVSRLVQVGIPSIVTTSLLTYNIPPCRTNTTAVTKTTERAEKKIAIMIAKTIIGMIAIVTRPETGPQLVTVQVLHSGGRFPPDVPQQSVHGKTGVLTQNGSMTHGKEIVGTTSQSLLPQNPWAHPTLQVPGFLPSPKLMLGSRMKQSVQQSRNHLFQTKRTWTQHSGSAHRS